MLHILLVIIAFFSYSSANFYIDEGCCQMFISEPNCLDQCLRVIRNESIFEFTRDLFSCALQPKAPQKITRCVTRSNYGLPIDRPVCCDKAIDTGCRDACELYSPLNDFNKRCNRTTEFEVYNCVEEYTHIKGCCYSSPVNMSCAAACNKAISEGPTLNDWVYVRVHCDEPFPEVKECMTQYTGHSNTSRFDCCNLSDNEQCRYACDKGMRGDYSRNELSSALFDACGDPLHDKTWLCIMSDGSSKMASPGELTAIQCCRKADSMYCQNLCLDLYNEWLNAELWEKFSSNCRYQPREEEMANCILDISEPCTLGCDHLSFCENLNNRPLDLFRTCSAKYDEGAEKDYNLWAARGWIQTPLVNITVLNITTCRPEIWKGIACVLQTQPCHAKSHSNSICNSVCVDLLTTCLDRARSDRSVEEICAILAPNKDPSSCIDLDHYLTPGMTDHQGKVTHPCQPSPCSSTQQCVLNRNCPSGDMYCVPYTCQDSCSIGATRDYHVEVGSWVRIPVVQDSDCYKVCTCDEKRKLSSCQELQCPGSTDCKIGNQYYAHMSQFTYDCNMCVCYSGLVTCTKDSCNHDNPNDVTPVDRTSGILPGGCKPYYSPVCGINGASYLNPCIARQFNMKESQLHYQDCGSVDVCINSQCPGKHLCRPKRRTCLDLRIRCDQYECEEPLINCSGEDLEPVCDTDNVQHAHMCSLYQQGKFLAHRGYCVGSCNATTGPVCGANRQSYASSCAAESDFMIVDYMGECAPPSDSDLAEGRFCSPDIVCPDLPKICVGNKVPGMCCPVCGAIVSLLPSQVLVAINEMYLSPEKLTVSLLCRKLNGLLSLSECLVQCNLGLYGDVIAAVYTTIPHPSWVQIEACNNEAIRLETMISIQHPRIQADLVLSTILGARTTTANITGSKSSTFTVNQHLFIVFISVIYSCFICRLNLVFI
ncbi:hypothetical protein ACHWQZ_G016988 [Mnemiopsis leidyi]